MSSTASSVTLSIVVPMFNEEAVLPLLVERLRPLADGLRTAYEVVAVDDGSSDATPVLLERLRRDWPELRVVRLRANSGHQAAISAGLQRSRGDYVVTLDADLQRAGDAAVLANQPLESSLAATFTAVEPGTGHLLAMSVNRLYGHDESDRRQESVNLNALPSRGAGSTYKVFVAAAALTVLVAVLGTVVAVYRSF